MKKTIACLTLALAMSAGATALAAPAAHYNNGEVVVTDAEDYKTVLIKKGDQIVFVDQAANKFDATAKFLMKSQEAVAGDYTIYLGGNGEVKTATMTIAAPTLTGEAIEGIKTGDDWGFKLENVSLSSTSKIAIKSVKGESEKVAVLTIADTWTNVEGTVNFALKLTNVPDDETVTVYLQN